jgi:hypothetical protein
MKKLKDEEPQWIEKNREEFTRTISDELLKIDKELRLGEEELLSLPTKEDRIQKVKEITKMVLNRME